MNKIYAIRHKLSLEEMLDEHYGSIVYVGKTNKELYQRLIQHEKDVSHPEKLEWFASNEYEIFELERDLEDYEVATREQYWIDFFGTKYKLNRMRAKKHTYNDCVDAMKRAKQQIKEMKKANK